MARGLHQGGEAAPRRGPDEGATHAWSNKKTSNVATTLTSLSSPGTASPKLKLVTKFVSGLFAGHTSTTTITASAPKGSCTSKGLALFNFVNTAPITSK